MLSKAQRLSQLPKMGWQEVGRGRLRMSNPVMAGKLDIRVEDIWSWFSVAVNTAVRSEILFAIPIGQPYTGAGASGSITLTNYHTTQKDAGKLPNPQKMLAKSIKVTPRPDINPNDLNALAGQYLLKLIVGDKSYTQGWAMTYPAGAGPFIGGYSVAGTTVPSATTTASSGANGWPSGDAISYLIDSAPLPVDIASQLGGQPPINGVWISQGEYFAISMDPTMTAGTLYTTVNTGGAIAATGINCIVRISGDHAVAVQ